MAIKRFCDPTAGRLELWFRLAILASLATVVVLTFANPWGFAADDSLFYLVVGRHLATDGAWTFNGLVPTNGVQPLWQLLTAGVVLSADLVGIESPQGQLRALFALNWALALVALAQMWQLLRRLGTGVAGRVLGVVVLGCCLCGPWGMFASEAHLVAVTLLWLLLTLERSLTRGATPLLAVIAGSASGLMMLARLDTVWVAGAAAMCLLLLPTRQAVQRRLLPVAVFTATSAALVLPYLIWNLVRFDNLGPISAAIKIDLGSPHVAIAGIGLFGVGILLSIWTGGLLGVLRKPRQTVRLAIWLIPAVGATVSSAFYVGFSRGPFTQWFWYFIPHAVALALTLAFLADRLADRLVDRPAVLRAGVRLACLALLVTSLAICANRVIPGRSNDVAKDDREFSTRVGELQPVDAVVATVDLPGVLAFVSGRRVVALDGLTADFRFQDRWRDDGVACAVEDLGVDYLVTVDDIGKIRRDQDSVTLALSSWLHREAPSELRGRDPITESPDRRFVLWHLEPGCRTRAG